MQLHPAKDRTQQKSLQGVSIAARLRELHDSAKCWAPPQLQGRAHCHSNVFDGLTLRDRGPFPLKAYHP